MSTLFYCDLTGEIVPDRPIIDAVRNELSQPVSPDDLPQWQLLGVEACQRLRADYTGAPIPDYQLEMWTAVYDKASALAPTDPGAALPDSISYQWTSSPAPIDL